MRRHALDTLYADTVGQDAFDRQRQEHRDRYACCGELETDGHHLMCSKRPDDQPAAHIDGQDSLL